MPVPTTEITLRFFQKMIRDSGHAFQHDPDDEIYYLVGPDHCFTIKYSNLRFEIKEIDGDVPSENRPSPMYIFEVLKYILNN